MKRRIYTLATVLLISMLAISPANAGGVSIKIGLGSITADLTAWGVGSGATANFSATGIPYVWCIAPGNTNIVPGQNPSQVSAEDAASLDASGKGKFSAFLSAEPNFSGLTGTDFGCPNNNWKATPFFVEWQTITVTITNPKGEWFTQTYTCTTTYIPDYTPNDGNTFNDGTITCQ